MEGANADSDHSMTWEDFFGSTTDLTPTLIGIYDSYLEPKNSGPAVSRFDLTAKDARNDPPLDPKPTEKHKEDKAAMSTKISISISPPKEPPKLTGGVKLPGFSSINKSSLYTLRTKLDSANESDNLGANNESAVKSVFSSSDSTFLHSKSSIYKSHLKSFKNDKVSDIITAPTVFDLSPNVKRMISSATDTSTGIKFQKKSVNVVRSSIRGHKSNIPLVGATSKISQSGVEILPSVEIYDQPYVVKITTKQVENDKSISSDSPVKTVPVKPEFRLEADHTTYDVPSNKQAIYDVPTHNNKTAFESLSLPYIDQSIELSITTNDREFDTKLASKDNSPDKLKPIEALTPTKDPLTNSGTNSLHRKDFITKCDNSTMASSTYPETIGSTGNLKLCSVPIKESRLHPPVVEVPRPLSMSSIASSSSTSSSGVQHKGGVNSAYLASIESLDDHSDADITSANGSNNYVNNAGVIKALPDDRLGVPIPQFQTDELIGLSQLERVCAEIVQTENVYVEDLRQVVEGYQHVWRNESVFSDEELNDLFNNIEDIYTFNRSFCEELNSCSLEATSLAKCFVSNNTGFTVYTSYCTGYPRTMERLAALASRPHSARVFRERQTALGHPLPLASYLLKPVQRILKYHLLLQNVVKLCACSDTESALLKMTSIAQYIDDMKRKHEHAVRVQEIQSLLYGWVGPDLTTYGELCAEGTFRVFGAKAMRHVFLFDKMILITKNREDGILAYKSHIMCNNMMLVESIAGAPLSFHVIPWDAPKSQITLQATSHRHKREWTLLLKRVILENYNAVIPSHARQLVMELGQNKTDDDILAEKSHNLITQASMRKQLSAPEYLEKRKLERERRKSFENGIRGRLKKTNRKLTVPVTQIEVTQVICDCSQLSEQRGTDYTCDSCYVDLCLDCESDLNNKDKPVEEKCSCKDDNHLSPVKCPECDRSLHYIDAGSAEHLERKQSCCKCSDFKSSQESVGKEFTGLLNKNRGYHSSDNIASYADKIKSKEDLSETNNSSLNNIRNIPKTCLKCAKIKENIVVSSSSTVRSRKSRYTELDRKTDTLRSKSKDDPQRSKLSKIGTWRRKSEPGLQQNVITVINKRTIDNENEKSTELPGNEKIEFECRNCGSNKISRKQRNCDPSDNSGVEIKMYNSKNIPKKISKLKKSRAKTLRHGTDSTAKFYAELSTDVSTENILHISESTDSINVVDKEVKNTNSSNLIPDTLSKDEDIDEETYKKLIEKTDSFKKNELEKVKYLNKQKVINEGSEVESECKQKIAGSCEEPEEPLEQIISQLLMQNREFQKLLKKQQLRNTAQRRHQRLLKSHSNPEPILIRNSDPTIIKPKYGRQTSENLDFVESRIDVTLSPPNEEQESDKDHIYETLRIVPKKQETQVESPKLPIKKLEKGPESDYVYLSFDQLDKIKESQDGIYDVPIKQIVKVENKDKKSSDYYVTIDKPLPRPDLCNDKVENVYDNVLDVCRRHKEPTELAPGEYLPMSSEQNPNTPEIWLSRQKEHFHVSRDRKSGSLPRSFQIVTSSSEEQNLSTFRNKPNNNNKTYLNRDGKVLSTDRPFTIASDKSELSFEDVENYMSDGDILKFNKSQNQGELEEGSTQNISQSTLELEEEIDRCYKNNFEKINLDANKNESVSTASQSNLLISATSSCEILTTEKNQDNNDVEIIHPEHKIYKPTSNMLSLKNVLNRFKTKKNTNVDVTEINANDPSSPDSTSSDLKSPTNEKRTGLNPRSYSKNLLQRFRNIIGDEQTDDGSRIDKTNKSEDIVTKSPLKNKIKVVITSTDVTPMSKSTIYSENNDFSRSVCNTTTLAESQNEKNNLEILSYSCDNLNNKKSEPKPIYEKSISMIANSSTSSTPSPSKSNSNSYQNFNKLPIYMQGSKHLGARIAQPDYVDPTTLMKDIKSDVKNVNVLINKNAVRPDSLFSNSSFVTSSSEGAYQEPVLKTVKPELESGSQLDMSSLTCDENFYEKSFDKIEQLTDEDVFRDSAVYSDQDEEETKTHTFIKSGSLRNEILRVESIKRNSSFRKTETVTSTTKVENKSSFQTRVTVTGTKLQVEKVNNKEQRSLFVNNNNARSKLAPPVPAKPKLAATHSINDKTAKPIVMHKSGNTSKKIEETSSAESINVRTIKRNVSYKQTYTRSESTPVTVTKSIEPKQNIVKKEIIEKNKTDTLSKLKTESLSNLKTPNSNIHIKRLSFERASLDSATRKLKINSDVTDSKRSSTEMPKTTSKTVLERRMEIESMARNVPNRPNKKSSQIAKPTSITNKMATFEKPTSDRVIKEEIASTSTDLSNIPVDINNIFDKKDNEDPDSKESWVKQVVNKFQ